jgi:hypothetical protein
MSGFDAAFSNLLTGGHMRVHRWVVIATLVVLVVALVPVSSSAQMQTSGEVIGTVTDPSGAAVPGADVTLVDAGTGQSRQATTDDSGNFILLSVVPGRYDLSIQAKGFAGAIAKGMIVVVGQTTSQPFQLTLSGSTQEVTVSGAIPLVQTTTSDVGGVLDREEIEALPLKNRDFTDLALLVPQIVRTPPIDPTKTRIGEISVAGTGGRQSNIFVDGFEDFDFVVGGVGYDVSPEAIQEFHVVTNNFSAEQARSVGAVVNMIERTGTNDIHGDAFYFFRNQALTARDFFQQEKSAYRRQQQGGMVGGPVIKDKLFAFGAFEDHRETDTGIVNTRGEYPELEGNVPLPFRRDLVTARMDVLTTEKNRLFYRFNLDNFNAAENVGGIRARSNGETNQTNVQAHAVSDTYILSPTKLNTIGFQFYRYANSLEPFSDMPEQQRPDLVIGLRTGDPQSTIEKRYEIHDNFSWTLGKQSLKFGAEYHYVQGSATFSLAPNGSFHFFEDAPLDSTIADLLVQTQCSTPDCLLGSASSSIVGLYVQDDYKVTPSLTLNLGLRWDYFSNENNKDFDGGLGLLAPKGSRSSDKNNFAPRIGFAYDPFRTGKFVVRAGYGIYYQNINFLTTLLEKGFDGRNIGVHVTFDPGGIDINDPYPGKTPQEIHDLFFAPPIGPLIALDNNLRTPYLQYSTAGIQWSFRPQWVFSVTGVHTLGIKGLLSYNANVDPAFNTPTPDAPAPNAQLCQRFSNTICEQFGEVPWDQNGDHLHYNALILAITKSMSKRFSLNSSYTLSKANNYYDDPTGAGNSVLSDPFNFKADYGPAQTDQRHRFIFSSVFDPSGLPPFFGKGWEISLISTFSTPLPYDITEASPNLDGATPIRPPGISRNNGARGSQARVLQLINDYRTSVGLNPITRALNPLSLNVRDTDLRLSKTIPLHDRFRIKLQAEVFNLLNSPNFITNSGNAGNAGFGFSGVSGVADSDNIGLPSSTQGALGSGGPRAFQLSAKLSF